jgi:hypothetical protein
LSKEVIRKLRLATDAEEKEDRDIVCGEVFADITGQLNAAARGELDRFFLVISDTSLLLRHGLPC